MKRPDFILVPSILMDDKNLDKLDWMVYGIVYWSSKLALQKCILTNESIATMLLSNAGSINNSINRLVKNNYLKSIYDRSLHVRELVPLIIFGVNNQQQNNQDEHYISGFSGTTSTDDLALHPQMHSTTNNKNINNIYNIYTRFVEKFHKEPGKYKLTDKRKMKIAKRLTEFSVDDLLLAIDHASEDAFYSGNNDRGWIADLDYICRSYEIVERLLNLKPNKYGNNKSFKHSNVAAPGKYDSLIER